MKNSIKNIGLLIFTTLLLIACNNNPSLQKYFVDSKENEAFISIDIPASILQLKESNVSESAKNTLNTIKKVNFLALQITDSNKDLFTAEKEKVKTIFKSSKYKELMRVNVEGVNVSINFLGEEDAIDEVVFFASKNAEGFALARVTGKNMNPSDIMKLSKEIKIDNNSSEFKELVGVLKKL